MSCGDDMTYFLVFLSGVLLAAMQSFNGKLSTSIGIYGTSFLVHLIGGILLAFYITVIKKEKIRLHPMPLYAYAGGIFGLILVSFTSLTIAHIGNVLTTVLTITGQIFLSILLDHFGLFGVQQNSFNVRRIPALCLILLGVLLISFGG